MQLETVNKLHRWYQKPLGKALAKIEKAGLRAIMQDIPGNYVLQLGDWLETFVLLNEHYAQVVLTGSYETIHYPEHWLQAESTSLPLPDNSIDIVVVPHVLEFVDNHDLLFKEWRRVLRSGGHLILLSFNPNSFWGVRALLQRRLQEVPWAGNFRLGYYNRRKLAHYNFKHIKTQSVAYLLPSDNEKILQKYDFLDDLSRGIFSRLGAVKITVAMKHDIELTPLHLKWQPAEITKKLPVVEPSTRGIHE